MPGFGSRNVLDFKMTPRHLDALVFMLRYAHNYMSVTFGREKMLGGERMSAHWDDLKTVMHLVRGGSLATAADALGVSYTTVARRVKRAEDDLGLQLFERLADGYKATEAGHTVARKASAMEVEEHDLMRGLLGADQKLSGALTITAPQLLCSTLLASVFNEFCEKYPDVELHVRANTELLDLNRREADLAIRVSNHPGDSLMGRRLVAQQSAVYGVRRWAEQIAHDPAKQIDWILHDKLQNIQKETTANTPNNRLRLMTDETMTMISAAQKGLGVVRMPVFLAHDYDDLFRIDTLPPQAFPDIWVVAHRDVWPSARVAAFREILVPHFTKHREMFVV